MKIIKFIGKRICLLGVEWTTSIMFIVLLDPLRIVCYDMGELTKNYDFWDGLVHKVCKKFNRIHNNLTEKFL